MQNDLHEQSNLRLFNRLPQDQCERVFASEMCDIEPEFLGFVGIYERLSQIIPIDWDVIDLGCAYAPQAWFFENHKSYIGVDLGELNRRFSAPNTVHHKMTIQTFVCMQARDFDPRFTFAICSYVPPWHGDNIKMVREAFQNVFTYYPASRERPDKAFIRKLKEIA